MTHPSLATRSTARAGSCLLTCCFGVVLTVAAGASGLLACFPVPPLSTRVALLRELRPQTLRTCKIGRVGSAHDGGYLMCINLVGEARAAYSFGIGGADAWGCDVAKRLRIPLHQYDCYDTRRAPCASGVRHTFHETCIGATTGTIGGRRFDTLARHIAREGDAGRRLLVKLDVEGSEWETLLTTPLKVLERIDQLVVEFHLRRPADFVRVLRRLKQVFFVVNVHFNNHGCTGRLRPIPSTSVEVLFVNRRLDVADPRAPAPRSPHPLDRPTRPGHRDCQVTWSK